MNQATFTESELMPMRFPISDSDRQHKILNFMEEYESAEEDEKGRLLEEFENNTRTFY